MSDVRLDNYRRSAYASEKIAPRSGFLHSVFRPKDSCDPLENTNRIFHLPVSFVSHLKLVTENEFNVVEEPYREAWMDWNCLKHGDYLSGPEGTFFVTRIDPPNPIIIVPTNKVVSLIDSKNKAVFKRFPVHIFINKIQDLSEDIPLQYTGIIPSVLNCEPRPGDVILVIDDTRYIIDSAELSGGAWTLSLFLLQE